MTNTTLDRQIEAEKRTVVRYAGYVERGVRPDAPVLLQAALARLEDLIAKQQYLAKAKHRRTGR